MVTRRPSINIPIPPEVFTTLKPAYSATNHLDFRTYLREQVLKIAENIELLKTRKERRPARLYVFNFSGDDLDTLNAAAATLQIPRAAVMQRIYGILLETHQPSEK